MGFLADLGRARNKPSEAIKDFQLTRSQLASAEKNRAVQDLQMQNVQQQMDIQKSKFDAAQKQAAEDQAPIPVETLVLGIEGGMESPQGKFLLDIANKNSIINYDNGGMGTTNKIKIRQFRQILSQPIVASKLSRIRIQYGRDNIAKAQAELLNKPDDEKLKAQVQQASDYLKQVTRQDDAMSKELEAQAKVEEAEAGREHETSEREAEQEFETSQEDKVDISSDFRVVNNQLIGLDENGKPKVLLKDIGGADANTLSDLGLYETKDGTILNMSDPKNPVPVYTPTDDSGDKANSDLAQLKEDFMNDKLTPEEYQTKRDAILSGKEFAPDVKTYFNPETQDTRQINVRDKKEVQQARNDGYRILGEDVRGFKRKSGELGAIAEEEFTSAATKERGKLSTLNMMDQLLDRFESGRLGGWKKTLQQWSDAFGIPIDAENLSSKEAFNAFANQLALQSRNMGPGQVLAGQMSDKDVQFLKDMNPQLIISKGGNKLILKIRMALAKRNQEIAELVPQFKKENRGIFNRGEFEQYVNEKMGKQSIFGIPDEAKLVGSDPVSGLPAYAVDGEDFAYIPKF